MEILFTGDKLFEMKEKIAIVVLGCPKNEVDAEVLTGELSAKGFLITSNIENADYIVIFTCSFIKDAVEEAVDTILELSLLNKKIIVTGCLVSRYGIDKLQKLLPEVVKFFGTYNYMDIINFLLNNQYKPSHTERFIYSRKNFRILNSSFAYVKISEGCSNRCSFCTIPSIKGNLFSRKSDDIIDEVKYLTDEKGINEIILISQNSGDYGKDLNKTENLNNLLKKLLNIKTLKWLRVLYTYPDFINDEFLELTTHEKFCNYLEIPIQHIDNEILKKMNRKSSEKDIRRILDKIKTSFPEIFLRTSLIVGFPGETESKFKKLSEFIKEYKFYNLGCFIYSPEEGTKAAKMKPQINEKTKSERFKEIMLLQKKIVKDINVSLLHKNFKALITGYSEESELLLQGRTEFQLPDIDGKTFITKGFIEKQGIYEIKITDFKDYDLIGEIIEPNNTILNGSFQKRVGKIF